MKKGDTVRIKPEILAERNPTRRPKVNRFRVVKTQGREARLRNLGSNAYTNVPKAQLQITS